MKTRKSAMTNSMKTSLLILGVASFCVGVSAWIGASSQRRTHAQLLNSLINAPKTANPRVDLSALGDVPPPVQKYLRRVLRPGQPVIHLARMEQTGTLRTGTHQERWMPFEAIQIASAVSPGFVWDAVVNVFPLFPIRVQDAYVAGKGSGQVLLFSAFSVSSAHGNIEMNSGALHRFLAEAVWYPTALFPSNKLRWQGVDDNKAIATLTDNGNTVSLEFWFDEDGDVNGIYSPARWGAFDGGFKQMPWEGHFKNYVVMDGIRVPSEGEVGWYDDGVWHAVWKGRVVKADYQMAE